MAIDGMSKEDLDMNEQIMQAIDRISVQCPVHKVNLNDDNKQSIAGRYLMTFSQVEEVLKPLAQMDDLTADTFLFFDNRHIAEVLQLFYGMCGVLVDARIISRDTRKDFLIDMAKTVNDHRVSTYGDFKNAVNDVFGHNLASRGIHDVSMKNMKTIINMIWFIPYAQIDAIADQIIEQYKKAHPEEFDNPKGGEPKDE